MLSTQMARTWALKEDSVNTSIIHLYSTPGSEGKHLSWEKVKSSLLNEEAHQKDREFVADSRAIVMEGDMNRGRDQ